MSAYNFEIGTDLEAMDSFEDDLGVFPPKQDGFVKARVEVEQADAMLSRHGWGETTLRWGYVTSAMRVTMASYFAGASSIRIYLRLRDGTQTTGSDNWVYCDVVMVWPPENDRPAIAGKIPDFNLPVRILENLGVSP
jgi:hypothetical protein